LCHYSTYYEAAIFGELQEATSDHFVLELDKNCAQWFVWWLYSGQLRVHGLETEELLQVYIFADRTNILALRRAVIIELVKREMDDISYRSVLLATENLPPSSPLCQFAVEFYTNYWGPSKAELSRQDQAFQDLPKEFLHLVTSGLTSPSYALSSIMRRKREKKGREKEKKGRKAEHQTTVFN
jgi:hypothetical protein